jgi:predicted pyridoxine 5'-phosphate oxidase superfamily flavin-nucleotide-binding protein
VGTLTVDMKRVIAEQRLGFYATVCPDGSPNLSPKGTTCVWDDDHICFAAIRSPQTVANIERGSAVEVNVVDPLVRKGYRFKGPATVYQGGCAGYYAGLELLRHAGFTTDRALAVVVVAVREARALVSPVYDDGTHTEHDVVELFRSRYAQLRGTVLSNSS